MIESLNIISTLLEKALRLTKSTFDYKGEKKIANIGHELFMVYYRANEILIIGDRIISIMEKFATVDDFMESKYIKNHDEWHDLIGVGSYSSKK